MVDGKVEADGSGCRILEALSASVQAKLDVYNVALESDMGSQWHREHIVDDNVNNIIVEDNSSHEL